MLILENETERYQREDLYRQRLQAHEAQSIPEMGNPLALTLDLKNVPLEVYEARNALK
jgi:hypothetical protein